MGLDNDKDKETIKSKIGAYKTLNAEKKKEAEEKRRQIRTKEKKKNLNSPNRLKKRKKN